MHPDPQPPSDSDSSPNYDIQKEILVGRSFSIADVIAQEGGSFLKGESPIPRLLQAIAQINGFIDQHLVDSSGALQFTLQNWINNETHVSQHLSDPLLALQQLLEGLTDENMTSNFYEFVRQVDCEWGRIYGERPHFQLPGQAPHPDDEYTHESVRKQLIELLGLLKIAVHSAQTQFPDPHH